LNLPEKVSCNSAFLSATVAPVDHAFMPVLIKLFLKVCGQAFFEKGCDYAG
jgi:hypothetical protein